MGGVEKMIIRLSPEKVKRIEGLILSKLSWLRTYISQVYLDEEARKMVRSTIEEYEDILVDLADARTEI